MPELVGRPDGPHPDPIGQHGDRPAHGAQGQPPGDRRVESWRLLADAVSRVGEGLDLGGVLRRVVESACQLVDARYGALGVLDRSGALIDFVFVGVERDLVDRIGGLPHGRGILGLLLREPRPLRLRDLTRHPAAYGFPEHHPPMRSFLGVPIVGHTGVLGNLYLTEKRGSDAFDESDEELAVAFAASAAAAIENARRYEDALQREQTVGAVREIATELLAGTDPDDVLRTVARRARELVGADLALVALPGPPGTLEVAVAEGDHAKALEHVTFPTTRSRAGSVLATGRSVVLDDARTAEGVHLPLVEAAGLGPLIVVPLTHAGKPTGTLTVGNRVGGRPLGAGDLAIVETFAEQASIVLDYGQSQRQTRRLALTEERERIARDLHDSVIQRLFALGLSLQGIVARTREPEVSTRLEATVDEIDTAIREIRTTIFTLGSSQDIQQGGVRTRLLAVARAAARPLGHNPDVRLDGPIDTLVPPSLAEDLLQTLREALSNVARHAHATSTTVRVTAGDSLTLEVVDNGIGPPAQPPPGGLGIANMRERAHHRGRLELSPADGQGTRLRWTVPLRA